MIFDVVCIIVTGLRF